jgi:hypothetical protein
VGFALLAFVVALLISLASPVLAQDANRDQMWRDDLAFLAAELPARHVDPFHSITQAEWNTAVGDLDTAIPMLDDDQIRVGLMLLVARIGDGHTSMVPNSFPRTRTLPLGFYPFADGLVLLTTQAEYQTALGLKLAQVGGKDIEMVIGRMSRAIPHENEGWLRVQVAGFLAYPEILYGLELSDTPDSAEFAFDRGDGSLVVINVAAVPTDQLRGLNWVSAVEADTPAFTFQRHTPPNYWYEFLPDSDTLYIAYAICAEAADYPFANFLAEVTTLINAQPIDRVVIDLRANTGGDSRILEPLIDTLAGYDTINQPGHLYVLIGPKTYSSAVLNAIQFQQRTHALLAGEPTGSKPNHYGEIQTLTLPNSGLQVIYSTKYHRYIEDDTAPALMPDLLIPLNAADFLAGRDPVLEAVIAGMP